jgi:hypothetical protein
VVEALVEDDEILVEDETMIENEMMTEITPLMKKSPILTTKEAQALKIMTIRMVLQKFLLLTMK